MAQDVSKRSQTDANACSTRRRHACLPHGHRPGAAPVAAGTGTLPEDVVEELLPLPRELVGQGQLFMLQVRGESMVGAGVLDRDYVVVRRQDSADNGDMVAALLPNDESEATVKHFARRGGHVQLLPDNPAFDPIDGDQAQILGKVVAVLRRLR